MLSRSRAARGSGRSPGPGAARPPCKGDPFTTNPPRSRPPEGAEASEIDIRPMCDVQDSFKRWTAARRRIEFTLALLPYVFLYRVRIALVRLGRIAPVLAQRAPLPQEIPVAVELDLHLPEARLLLVARLAVLEEAVLLGDQRFDVGENRCIFCGLGHGFSSVNLPSGGRPRTGTRRASRPRRSTPRAGSRSRRRRARRRPRAPRA